MTFSLLSCILNPSGKEATLKGKSFTSLGSKFSPFRVDPISGRMSNNLTVVSLESIYILLKIKYEPAYDKTYNKTCVTSEHSDQLAHPCSLIRLFAEHMCLQQRYPARNEQEPLPYSVYVQADLSLCWSHRSYCRYCRDRTNKMACAPSKDRSAWTSAQSDQNLCCPHEESLNP